MESNMVEFKMTAIIKLSQSEWAKVFFVQMVGNNLGKMWVSLRGKTKMAKFKMARIQDGCHHQVESEWKRLSQIKLVWVKSQSGVKSVIWVNLGEENKVSESNMAEFKMTAIMKLSQNEWVKIFLIQQQ